MLAFYTVGKKEPGSLFKGRVTMVYGLAALSQKGKSLQMSIFETLIIDFG